MSAVWFQASGIPVPQGRMKAMKHAKSGRVVLFHSSDKKLREWRKLVGWHAKQAMGGAAPLDCPLAVHATFYMPKPLSVKRELPSVKPDLDKLVRALGDSLAGVVYTDDSRVCAWHVAKLYDEKPRVEVEVRRL